MERLDYIIAIAEEQNITKAAERLFISQPALTKYLNKLEEDYGVTLFDRSRSPIRLTEAGKLFLTEKIKIDSAEQNLRHRLELLNNRRKMISIGIGYSRAESWIPKLLTEFSKIHPDIDIEINGVGELSLSSHLANNTIDIGIGAFEPLDRDLEWSYLTIEKLCLLIPLCYNVFPKDISPVMTIDEPYQLDPSSLDGLNYISPRKDMGSYDSYQILRSKYSIRLGRLITTNNSKSIRKMILSGLGYGYCAIGSRQNLLDDNDRYAAACGILPGLPTRRYTVVAYKKSNPKSELLKELVSILDKQIKENNSTATIYWKNVQ